MTVTTTLTDQNALVALVRCLASEFERSSDATVLHVYTSFPYVFFTTFLSALCTLMMCTRRSELWTCRKGRKDCSVIQGDTELKTGNRSAMCMRGEGATYTLQLMHHIALKWTYDALTDTFF